LHPKRSVCFSMSDAKEYIIDQAYGLFLGRSYEAVSISEISNAIGFTKGALYHHFRNKEELFKAVIDKYLIIDELEFDPEQTTLKQYLDLSVQKAQKITGQLISTIPAYIPLNLLSLFIDAFRHYPGFAANKEDLIKSEINRTIKVLDLAIERGEIRGDLNTLLIAEMIFTLNTGIARNLVHNNMTTQTAIEQMREQLFEFYKLLQP